MHFTERKLRIVSLSPEVADMLEFVKTVIVPRLLEYARRRGAYCIRDGSVHHCVNNEYCMLPDCYTGPVIELLCVEDSGCWYYIRKPEDIEMEIAMSLDQEYTALEIIWYTMTLARKLGILQ